MSFPVTLTARVRRDVDDTYLWLAERSLTGAGRWYAQFLKLLGSLGTHPESFGLATEAQDLAIELREALFKTRRGNRYRALFVVDDEQVRVLTVRGPGQRPITTDDLLDG